MFNLQNVVSYTLHFLISVSPCFNLSGFGKYVFVSQLYYGASVDKLIKICLSTELGLRNIQQKNDELFI